MGKPFQQIVKFVQGSSALVQSKKGNIYPVIVSDFVRLNRTLKVGDIALVRRINGKYYLIDIVEKEKPSEEPSEEPKLTDWGYDY